MLILFPFFLHTRTKGLVKGFSYVESFKSQVPLNPEEVWSADQWDTALLLLLLLLLFPFPFFIFH